MSERLGEIHRRLCADNVPATLEYRPGLGTVLLAGIDPAHPSGRSAVLVHEAGGLHWIRQGGATFRVPAGTDDDTLVNSVKLRVVHGWAEQGDPDAAAVLVRVREMTRTERPRPAAAYVPYLDPFTLAFRLFDQMLDQMINQMFSPPFRMGWTMTMPSPWGMYRSSFEVR